MRPETESIDGVMSRAFETVLTEAHDVDGQIEPLVLQDVAQRNAGVHGVYDEFLGTGREQESATCLRLGHSRLTFALSATATSRVKFLPLGM